MLIVSFFLLSALSIYLNHQNVTLQEKIDDMESRINEQELGMEVQAMSIEHESEMESIQGEVQNGYESWQEAEAMANHMYEDSDGHFDEDWGMFLALEAMREGIDPFLVYELLRVESGEKFEPDLVGPETEYGHAYGLAQFMKNTGPWIADMAGLPYEHDKLFDPYYSIQLAVVYLDFLYDKYEDWDHALTAYHRGIYGLEQYIEDHGHAKSWYAEEIQEKAQERSLVAFDK
nr:transglycosylase SLT domain-containing protein [Texcoconibacillus texcoconensis]